MVSRQSQSLLILRNWKEHGLGFLVRFSTSTFSTLCPDTRAKLAPSESVGVLVVASKPEVYMTRKGPNAAAMIGFSWCCHLVNAIFAALRFPPLQNILNRLQGRQEFYVMIHTGPIQETQLKTTKMAAESNPNILDQQVFSLYVRHLLHFQLYLDFYSRKEIQQTLR